MNHNPEKKRLLEDVFDEVAPADFRATLLGETLRLAHRRRRSRRARQIGSVLSVLLLVFSMAWLIQSSKTDKVNFLVKAVPERGYQLVKTRPLSVNDVVTTRDFPGVTVISSQTSVAMVTTKNSGFQFINDGQLLALVGSRPAMLIHNGPNSEELVVADPEGQKLFSPR